MAHAAGRARGQRGGGAGDRRDHAAAVRPLSGRRHHRLVGEPLLHLRQSRPVWPQRRHFRHPPFSFGSFRLIDGAVFHRHLDRCGVGRAGHRQPAGQPCRPCHPYHCTGGTPGGGEFSASTRRARRMLAFVYAAVLAAFRGWLYAHMQRSVNPTPFGLNAGIDYLLMAVVAVRRTSRARCWALGCSRCERRVAGRCCRNSSARRAISKTIVFGAILVLAPADVPAGIWPHIAHARPRPPPRAAADAARCRLPRHCRRTGAHLAVHGTVPQLRRADRRERSRFFTSPAGRSSA